MRLWTLHPQYLDPQGLVALWRETLLARAVLSGQTRGYRQHPQLLRFKNTRAPLSYINQYLRAIFDEAQHRGYAFDRSKLTRPRPPLPRLPETDGQLHFEWRHLKHKLRVRAPFQLRTLRAIRNPLCHPLFRLVKGDVQWEKTAGIPRAGFF